MKSTRFLLHITFWFMVYLIMIKFYPSQKDKLILISLILFIIPTYLTNEILVNIFYKKQLYTYFVISLIVFNFVYVFIVYWIPTTIYKKDNDDFFTIFLDFLIFTAFTSSIKIARYSYLKEKEYAAMQIQQLKTELSLLKSQVNPHFLFNTLNNLYGLIIQNQNEQAGNITLKLSDLMRYLLESGKIEQVSLQKEIKFLEDYLALEKIRLANQADIRLEISGFEKEVFVAPLLFIPLVENAFKHGLQTISENNFNNFAHFSLSLQGNELYFEAKNSVGKNLLVQEKSGIGLENLRKRLLLIYPKKHFLEIEENERFFKVILQINL